MINFLLAKHKRFLVVSALMVSFTPLYGMMSPGQLQDAIANGLSEGLSGGVAGGLSRGFPAAVAATAEEFKKQFDGSGNGSQAMNNFFSTIANNFAENGQGYQASQNFGNSMGQTITTMGNAFNSVFAKNAAIVVGGTFFSAVAWYGTKTFWNYVERQMKKPKIIIRASHKGFFAKLSALFAKKPAEIKMVFNEALQERLTNIIAATKNSSAHIKAGKNNVKYRNLMLYGAPGTGKTMFAEKLAEESGMEFVVVSGASFSKAGAIEAMDELFAWASKSKTGLVIFIDEAESLMINRDNLNPDSDGYKVFTNFLNYTGTRSNKFMIVMATNRLAVIDEAMHRRIDDLIEFKLPELKERKAVLDLYCSKYLFALSQNDAQFVQKAKALLTESEIERIALLAEGFSSGDLEGLINMIQTDCNCTKDGMITQIIIDQALACMIEKHNTFK